MSFTELQLHPSLLKAIGVCGFTEPTPIQAQAIPVVLEGRDLMASAQTGTGKTAAFVLPALHRLAQVPAGRGRGPRVLVLTPTRELASQVTEAIRSFGKFMRVRSGAILGGMPYREQLRLLSQPVDLIVATPGRLLDHLERRSISLDRLEFLVLDEADRMLDMGFIEDVEKIAAATPASRQTLLFSATLDQRIRKLAGGMLQDPALIQISPQRVTHDHIEQRLMVADDLSHKNRLLQHLVAEKGLTRAIIFSATRRDAESLAIRLSEQGYAAAALHGDMPQGARNRTIANLRRGTVSLLVATDVAARGLDVTGISHVINFDLPKMAEDYVHRIGRTGRAGATGTAISFVSANELSYLERIERYTGRTLDQHVIDGLEPTRPLRRLSPGAGRGGAGQKRAAGAGGKNGRSAGGYGRQPGKGGNGKRGTSFGRKPASPWTASS
ncbi:ATP-dependent RNA helicase RhlE [Geotalea uraniireducens]|uniref:ATP-dependent RNA helicase RhlE n=1 Tax=Geotalea uraniireducens TaxID=351604 RepID=A0ABN6VP01_9BACT|nr:DEAD/DEAH box helicase [Geotalea uraniireducens]BDV41908.1 ATP-dependent RNA helicase RhlE [Geotalea uraniireducens]